MITFRVGQYKTELDLLIVRTYRWMIKSQWCPLCARRRTTLRPVQHYYVVEVQSPMEFKGQVMVELELPSANSKPSKGAVKLCVIKMSEYDSSSTST